MSKEIIATNLRLPKKLHASLKELAIKDNRSLHNYIITTLENHVSNQTKETTQD